MGYCDDSGRCWDEKHGSGENIACEDDSGRCWDKEHSGGDSRGSGDCDGSRHCQDKDSGNDDDEGGDAASRGDDVADAPHYAQPPASTPEDASGGHRHADGEQADKKPEADGAAPHVVVSGASSLRCIWSTIFLVVLGIGGGVVVLKS